MSHVFLFLRNQMILRTLSYGTFYWFLNTLLHIRCASVCVDSISRTFRLTQPSGVEYSTVRIPNRNNIFLQWRQGIAFAISPLDVSRYTQRTIPLNILRAFASPFRWKDFTRTSQWSNGRRWDKPCRRSAKETTACSAWTEKTVFPTKQVRLEFFFTPPIKPRSQRKMWAIHVEDTNNKTKMTQLWHSRHIYS